MAFNAARTPPTIGSADDVYPARIDPCVTLDPGSGFKNIGVDVGQGDIAAAGAVRQIAADQTIDE